MAYLHWGLGYRFLRADALGYWRQSGNGLRAFNPFHVPGWPWLIALVRAVWPAARPVPVMAAWSLVLLLVGTWAAYALARAYGGRACTAALAGWLYALWPLTGLMFAANLWADVPATALFLLGWLAFQRGYWPLSVPLHAYTLLTHKALWPVIGLWWLLEFLPRCPCRWPVRVLATGLLLAPLAAFWVAGARELGRWNWMIASNWLIEIRAHRWPAFAGVIDTCLMGGWKAWVKGCVLVGHLVLALGLAAWAARRRWAAGLAVSLAVVALFAVLNAYEVIAAVRFSRVLAVPLALAWSRAFPAWEQHPRAVGLAWALNLLGHLIYGWYTERIFYD